MFATLTSRLSLCYAPSMLGGVSRRVLAPFNGIATRNFHLSQSLFDPAAKTRAAAPTTPKAAASTAKATKAKTTTPARAKATKKAPAKRAVRKVAAAKKPVRITRTAAAKKPAKPKAIRLSAEHKPPTAPAGPFVLFFQKYYQGADMSQVDDKRAAILKLTAEAGRVWSSLTEHEKQAYRDEYKAAYDEYTTKRDEYYKNLDPTILKEINRRRVKRGKTKFHTPASVKVRRPASPYVLFFMAERARDPPSPSGWEENKAWMKELAAKWNAMSDTEKKPYNDQYAEARKAYVAAQA